jgi:hypothetical protein
VAMEILLANGDVKRHASRQLRRGRIVGSLAGMCKRYAVGVIPRRFSITLLLDSGVLCSHGV